MSISTSARGRVLIVDDDRKILDLLVDLLVLEGYEISTAVDGAEAIELVRTFDPDIVVSDVVMPNVGGLELCRHLKADQRTAQLPVLLISGRITSDDAGIEGLHAGADDYLDLPFRNEELLVKVARLVERQRLQKHYSELFENANDIIYTHDLKGNFTSLNRSGERITGYSRDEAAAMNITDVIAPEYLEFAQKMMAQKTSDNAPTIYEIDIISKQGRRVRLEVSTRLVFRDGEAIGIQGIGRDLTERKHSEEALRQSQAFLAQQAEREAMTHRISQAIRCSLDSHEIYQTAVRELGSYLKVDRCSLFIRNDRAECAMNVAEYHAAGVQPAASDFALVHLQSLIAALDKTGVLPFSHAANDQRIADLYQNILSKADVKSIMYVAIRVGEDVLAAFALSTTREIRHWSEADIALSKAVADQTGIAIRQAELYQKAEATSMREALVNRLTMAIRASLSLSEVLSTATVELGRALAASRVHLFLHDSDEVGSPLEHEFLAEGVRSLKDLGVNYDDPIGRRLSSSLQPLIIDDARNYDDDISAGLSDYVRGHARRFEILSQINYPLVVKGQFRGVLCVHQTDRKRLWTEDEVSLVEALA
ncbi:MAG TPA: GAF domain-containing protein, partial [Pyrinomonadaceae bacterium]|nr:GAF domain-containing protein [Pyrinomonadaceae bacterium]